MGKLIFLILIIIVFINRDKIKNFFECREWEKQIANIHNYDSNIIKEKLMSLSDRAFMYGFGDIPYGRARWFILGNDSFDKERIEDTEFYGFSPIRSNKELDFHEYGILLTQDGVYFSWQLKPKSKKEDSLVQSVFCPFHGLWKITSGDGVIKFYYMSGTVRKVCVNGNEGHVNALVAGITGLINTGYTHDLKTEYISEKIDEEIKQQAFNNIDVSLGIKVGALGAVYANLPSHFKTETLNSIVNNPQGHGYAAEYANNVIDQIKHPFKDVRRVGQDNARNGADRIVGNTKIQTKYCSSARNSVNAAFESKADGGMYKYKGMQLEVPKDQYNEAVELMKKKIADGKVPGHTNPEDAYKIVRKGNTTWDETKLIAKGGNITSLKYDLLDGVVTTLPVAGISFAIMFAQAKWSGESTKDAALLAASSGLTTLVVGTVVYTGSQQIAKVLTKEIAQHTGKKLSANVVAQKAGFIISVSITIGPDIFNVLAGRISKQQLLKNSVVAGGGMAGGVLASAGAGAALGSVVPGAGNAIGAVVGAVAGIAGGIAGSKAAKSVMDHYIEDDRVEMFAQLKEEYIDIVMAINLTQEEFDKVQEIIFDKKLARKLKEMFAANRKEGSRVYARESIVEPAVVKVIEDRGTITENDLQTAIMSLQAS